MAETSNIREFRLRVDRHSDRADSLWRERTRAVALRALNGVVQGTRVDTGRARGNWQVTLGTPAEGFDQDLGAPGGRTGSDAPTRREDPVAKGARVIADAVKGANTDQTIWLHNGVPYVGILEDMDKMVAGNVEALRTWLASQ